MAKDHTDDIDHGNTVASWVSVLVIIFAVAGATLFYILDNDIGVFASGVGVLVGAALGPILKALGYGAKK